MADKRDVIVVGAGMGGLAAAARLIRKGMKALMLDRNTHPGGTAYVYRRKGFAFPMGPLGFSSPSMMRDMLDSLANDLPLELIPVKYRLHAFGLDLPLSLPYDDMVAVYSETFPGEKAGIETFFAKMEQTAAAIRNGETDNMENVSGDAYIRGIVKDPRLRRILGSMGTEEPYAALPLLASMWDMLCGQGIFYPAGGMKAFCDRITDIVAESGEIRLNTEVQSIKIAGGRAAGVILKNGEEIDAEAVISNADFKTTFLKLIDKANVPPELLDAVSRAKQTMSNVQVCLGVDKSKVDLRAFEEADRIVYRRAGGEDETGPDWSAAAIDPSVLAGREMEIGLWSAHDHSLAPEGCAVIVIRVEADYDHFTKLRPAWRKRSAGYMDYKMKLGHALIREASKIAPGLDQSVVVMDVATPLTFEEMGGRSAGAVAGWSWDYSDSRDIRARELVVTPIANLYMAGYQAFSSLFMGGIPTAIESGIMAAQAAISNAGPARNFVIPGSEG